MHKDLHSLRNVIIARGEVHNTVAEVTDLQLPVGIDQLVKQPFKRLEVECEEVQEHPLRLGRRELPFEDEE